MKQFSLFFFGIFLSLSAFTQPIIYVTPSGAGNTSGSSWTNALPSTQLPNRVVTASAGTQFWVAAGTYRPTTTTDRTASFSIASGVSVYGGFSGTETTLKQRVNGVYETILSGDIGIEGYASDNSQHVIVLKNVSQTFTFDGLTIRDGQFINQTAGAGINVDVSDTTLTISITHCRFINNVCFLSFAAGGAISITARHNAKGNLTIRDCYFSGNKAASGGAFAPQTLGGTITTVIEDCVFLANAGADEGGAISNRYVGNSNQNPSSEQSSLIIRRCSFLSNQASYTGGSIVSGTSNLLVENCIFSNNYVTVSGSYVVGGGGAIDNSGSRSIFRNCVFTANQAGYGGAVFSHSDDNTTEQTFVNCTFAKNSATISGGVFYNIQERFTHNPSINHANETNLINSLIWQNSSPDSSLIKLSLSGSSDLSVLSATYSLIQGGYPGTGNLHTDPLFVDATNGDFRLKSSSPAINAGDLNTSGLPTTDLAGNPRIQSGRVDMGAYEFFNCLGMPCLPFRVERKSKL